jgi:hypothetical protein
MVIMRILPFVAFALTGYAVASGSRISALNHPGLKRLI